MSPFNLELLEGEYFVPFLTKREISMEYLYQFNYLEHLIKNGCDWYFPVIQIFKNSIKK